ncbi:MAG: DNA replication and repair protein RecF [Chloroflexia bacterium]|nr:DNA replication and repair protein RecF [Chloroflexia bacterium]
MHLANLTLEQFRPYERLELVVPPQGLRITGRNASGKTSVLEALVLLSTTRSSRATFDRELVRWSSGIEYGLPPYARVEGIIHTGSDTGGDVRHAIDISIEVDGTLDNHARKRYRLDQQSIRAQDLVGVLKCVLFSPEDVLLVSGPPADRRRQIDILASQIDRNYLQALTRFGKVLSQRNSLLKSFARERIQPRDSSAIAQLTFWDEQLVGPAAYLVTARLLSTARLTELIAHRSANLMDGAAIEFRYIPKMAVPEFMVGEHAATTRQRVGAALTEQLRAVRVDEFRRGLTLVGPHRDDFVFAIDGRELSLYGSRGQQRLGILAYKLSEGDLIAEMTGERPILLLDDVLSELDSVHRDLILRGVKANNCQLLVTSTDAMLLDHPALHHLPLMVAENGDIGLA